MNSYSLYLQKWNGTEKRHTKAHMQSPSEKPAVHCRKDAERLMMKLQSMPLMLQFAIVGVSGLTKQLNVRAWTQIGVFP